MRGGRTWMRGRRMLNRSAPAISTTATAAHIEDISSKTRAATLFGAASIAIGISARWMSTTVTSKMRRLRSSGANARNSGRITSAANTKNTENQWRSSRPKLSKFMSTESHLARRHARSRARDIRETKKCHGRREEGPEADRDPPRDHDHRAVLLEVKKVPARSRGSQRSRSTRGPAESKALELLLEGAGRHRADGRRCLGRPGLDSGFGPEA